MAPIVSVESYANRPAPQPSISHQFIYVALILVGIALLWGIVDVCSRIGRWRSAKKMIVDVESASIIDSFKPRTIAVPPPTATLGRPHMQEQFLDSRSGYVSQGKMLSGNGRGFFG